MTDQNIFSISELQQQANDGDAQAQFDLALCYRRGANVEGNKELALMWLSKSAEQGLARAQLEMGVDCSLTTLLGKSIEIHDYVWQMFNGLYVGLLPDFLFFLDSHGKTIQNGDAELGFKWFTKAAEQNCVEAQFFLACCYYDGIGTSLNHQLAFEWFKKAAEQGCAIAQFLLASLYFEGRGTEQNDELAFEWLKKAAEQDFADAQRCLAFCYLDGKCVEQNVIIAVEWITKRAENEYHGNSRLDTAEACLLLGELYNQGNVVEKNKELALKWNEKGEKIIFPNYFSKEDHEKNYATHQLEFTETWSKVYCRLARFYLKDKCADYNFALGMEYRLKAVEIGHTFAEDWSEDQYQLALRYFEGKGVEKSYEHGMKWMISAAAQGHAEANNWLTNAYLSLGIPSCLSDKEDADKYYQYAFDWCIKELDGHNSTEAYLLLGVLYYSGKGVEQSDERALECFKKAQYISDNCYPDPDRNQNLDAFIQLYLSNCCAQGKGVAKHDCAYRINYLPESYLTLFGKVFVEGIIAMPFNGLQHNKVFLTLLRISIYKKAGEYELAKEFTKEVFDKTDGMDKNFKEICLTGIEQEQEIAEKNKDLESEIKQKEDTNHRMQRLVEQFTHSLGNVIFPDTIYQVAERLKNNPECRKDVLLLHEAYHSEIIIKLQGELLRQRYANTNPEKFRQFIRSCRQNLNDADNSKSIEDILDYAASRVTARFLNQHYAGLNSIRDKVLSKKNVSLNALKKKFEDDILLNKSLRPIAWLNQNLRPIQITEISPLWKKVFILSESHAEALLFGYFSEILFNAFKYADYDKDEFLTLIFDEKTINGKTYLSCNWENPVKDKVVTMLGTGKGLDAIKEDLKQLNDTENPEESLLISRQENKFQVTLFFKKDLLVNELPILKLKRKANTE